MPLFPIHDADDPRIALYRGVTDAALLGGHGLFVAEGRLVVRRLLEESPFEAVSVLVTGAAHESLSPLFDERPGLDVYVAPQPVLNAVAGFHIHRGCLALGRRPPLGLHLGLAGDAASRIVVLEAVSNADNVGGIFRTAAALGVSAVLLAPGCCDPLYRKAIRTSIGATLVVRFTHVRSVGDAATELRASGFLVAALTPAVDAVPIAEAATTLRAHPRVALAVGAEGDGLTPGALASADVCVRIPMADGVDSLNVNVAAAIALDRLRR